MVALSASLAAPALELDRPFAGRELRVSLAARGSDEAATFAEVSDDGAGAAEVMYEVDRKT